MIDPVREELRRRLDEPWPWRSALAAAVSLHLLLAALALLAPNGPRRPLTLPSVRVRVAPAPGPAAPKPAAAAPLQQPRAAAQAVASPSPRGPQEKPFPRTKRGRETAAATPRPAAPATGAPATEGSDVRPGVRSTSGSVGLGSGTSGEVAPSDYYLSRLLGMIEGNWFRPPAPAETRCRVRCRIDRSGRLLEVGVEEPSTTPAFDRAALRAVYACAPFPPLPEAYGGAALTLHLEFGP